MKDTDAVILAAFIAEMQPAQRFSEHTPDAWAMVLADVPADLQTAKEAVVRLAKRVKWFTPGEVRTEIRKALPPSQLSAPAPARRELDWSREATEARSEAAARAKADAAEEIARRGFKYSRVVKDSAAATDARLAAALERHRAGQAAADAANPAPDMPHADGDAAAIESVKNIVSQFRKASS